MINHCCERMDFFLGEKKVKISYSPRFREYGIDTSSGGMQLMKFCPWCNSKLPTSLRDAWFEALENLGIEAELFVEKGDVPDQFLTDEWWKSNSRIV